MYYKVGQIFTCDGRKVKCVKQYYNESRCPKCFFHIQGKSCIHIPCGEAARIDRQNVFFVEVNNNENNKVNDIGIMEIKSIVVPDGWECIVKNGIATFEEKKETTQNPPRSWEEFYNNYPLTDKECYISSFGIVLPISSLNIGNKRDDKNWCASKEEAEAFLALMRLRQLRKAWVGDWDFVASPLLTCHAIVYTKNSGLRVRVTSSNHPMSFPTTNMAEDFFKCFKELLEKAKIFL